MEMEKSLYSFNLKYIKENNGELWEKYKLMLAFVDDDVDEIHYFELADAVGIKAAYQFLLEMLPPPLKDRMEGKISEEEYIREMQKYIIK